MRAKEFIREQADDDGAIIGVKNSLRNLKAYPGMPANDAYQIYRFGLALATHGNAPAQGPTSQDAVIAAYSPEEDAIVSAAEKTTGKHGKSMASPGSMEQSDVNTVSPVAKFVPTKK